VKAQEATQAGDIPEVVSLNIAWPNWGNAAQDMPSLVAICDQLGSILASLEQQRDTAQRDVSQFNSIKQWWNGIKEANEKMADLDRIRKGLKRAFDIVHETRVAFTQGILDGIRQEADRLFQAIHPGENIGLEELKMEEERRGSVSQTGVFHGHTDIPPQAVAPGSLELPLDLIVLGSAIIIQEHPLLQKLREVITRFFDIKLRLRGQPIHVADGNVITIDNSRVHMDQLTLQCLNPGSEVSRKWSEAFHFIEEDREIGTVRVTSNKADEPLAHVPRDKFAYLHPETPIGTETLGQRYAESRETLTIRQPAFDAELAWRFVWRDTKISAQVQDADFQQSVETGREVFVAGDSLEVDLRRLQEYDPASETHTDKSYTITRVWRHNRRAGEHNLFS